MCSQLMDQNCGKKTGKGIVLAPDFKKQRGRPVKKRRREGEYEQQGTKNKKLRRSGLLIKCSNCGRQGHNKSPITGNQTLILMLGHLLGQLQGHLLAILLQSLLGLLLLQHNPVIGLLLQLYSLLPLLGHQRQQKYHLLRAGVKPNCQLREAKSDMWLDFFFNCDCDCFFCSIAH